MNINVLLEDNFEGHQGNDLYDSDRAHSYYRQLRMKKTASLQDLMEQLAFSMVKITEALFVFVEVLFPYLIFLP